MSFSLLLLQVLGIFSVVVAASPSYLEIDGCEVKTTCTYSYITFQESMRGSLDINVTFQAIVKVSCDSVGDYDGEKATKYCMEISDAKYYLFLPSEFQSDSENSRQWRKLSSDGQYYLSTEEHFTGMFCFVRTESGKIPAVYHPETDSVEVVNTKKSIAAAFQANFRGTELEPEEDPQSAHYSHYSYADDGKEMHRSFSTDDVIKFSLENRKENIKLTKEEDMRYESDGTLTYSAGVTTVELMLSTSEDAPAESLIQNGRKRRSNENILSSFNGMDVKANFTLQLQKCSKTTEVSYNKRSIEADAAPDEPIVSSLKAEFNSTSLDLHSMEMLYNELPDNSLDQLQKNPKNDDLAFALKRLVQLEAKYGPQPTDKEALLHQIIHKLRKIQGSTDMDSAGFRAVLYFLLCMDGSELAQKEILRALKTTTDHEESKILAIQIAFIEKVQPDFINEVEQLITKSGDPTNPLLLSYGVLAKQRKINGGKFLESLANNTEGTVSSRIQIIHALGNLGSSQSIDFLCSYVASDNLAVSVAALYALRQHITDQQVRLFLTNILKHNASEVIVDTIIQTLSAGKRQMKLEGTDLELEIDSELFPVLLSAAQKLESLQVYESLLDYLTSSVLEDDDYSKILYECIRDEKFVRSRRDAWDDSDTIYNSILPLEERQSDVSDYYKLSYLWNEKFGNDKINFAIAAGVFAGFSKQIASHLDYKLFARVVGKATAYGSTAEVVDIKFLVQNDGGTERYVIFVSLVGHVLVNVNETQQSAKRSVDECLSKSWPVADHMYPLLNVNDKIVLYQGNSIDFSVGLMATMNGMAGASSCCDGDEISLVGSLLPKAAVMAEGSASMSIANLFIGGVKISGNLNYYINASISAKLCLSNLTEHQTCINVTTGWEDCKLELFAYYQVFASIELCCSGGLPSICGTKWGPERKVDAMSYLESYGTSNEVLFGSCSEDDFLCENATE